MVSTQVNRSETCTFESVKLRSLNTGGFTDRFDDRCVTYMRKICFHAMIHCILKTEQ